MLKLKLKNVGKCSGENAYSIRFYSGYVARFYAKCIKKIASLLLFDKISKPYNTIHGPVPRTSDLYPVTPFDEIVLVPLEVPPYRHYRYP